MVALTTGVLLVKAHAHDNHRLLSYHDHGFCDTIITLLILLNITGSITVELIYTQVLLNWFLLQNKYDFELYQL